MLCQEPQQGQQSLCGVLLKKSHSVIHQTCWCALYTWHRARCMGCRDSSHYCKKKKVLSLMERGPKLEDFILKREYRERTPIGVPAVHSHVPRHIIYLVTLSILESEGKSRNFPRFFLPLCYKLWVSVV